MTINIVMGIIGVAIIGAAVAIGIKKSKKAAMGIAALGAVVALLGASVVVIPTGYTGVRITFGQVDDSIVPQGFSLKVPFAQSVARVNNKQQEITIASDSGYIESTIDGKIPIQISNIGVTFKINSDKSSYIYKTVSDPDNLITFDLISSAVKTATTSFDTDSVVVRTNVEPAVMKALQAKANAKYGEGVVDIIQVTLDDISFSEEYNEAINNKNIAKQEAEEQAIVNQKNIDQANAEAEALLIEAEAEKEANALKQQSLTDQILQQQMLEKWDGKLPSVVGDSNAMFDMSSLINSSNEE